MYKVMFQRFVLFCIIIIVPSITALAQDTIHIAALLPLNHTTIQTKKLDPKIKPIFDLLAGMETAHKILVDSGCKLVIHYYDTEGSLIRINEILTWPELLKTDAIIGPIYGVGSAEIAIFAARNNITMLNALSPKLYWDRENKMAFITGCSAQSQGTKAALFALKNLPSTKCAIIYGNTLKDSLTAYTYRKIMIDSGRVISLIKKVSKNSAANLPKFLKNSGLDSTGHIFAPNNEQLVQMQLPGTVQLLGIKTPIIALGSWVENTQIEYRDWENLGGYFLWPEYQDFGSPAFQQFSRTYKNIYNLPPNYESSIGFESVYQVYNGLHKFGKQGLPSYWNSGTEIKTILFTNWQFSPDGANTYVPIYQLVENGPKRVE